MKISLTRLAFFAYAYNLAEVTHAIEIAKAVRSEGLQVMRVRLLYLSLGGAF